MPGLPTSDIPWPPNDTDAQYAKFREWAAWYSGEPARLADVYAAPIALGNPQAPWWRFWSRAAQIPQAAQRAVLHVPIASDLAALSAALLMGEAPRIRIPEAHEAPDPNIEDAPEDQGGNLDDAVVAAPVQPAGPMGGPGAVPGALAPTLAPGPMLAMMAPKPKPVPKPVIKPSAASKAEDRLREIMDEGGVIPRLLEAAETAAAMGGAYLYPAWDVKIADIPLLAVAQADMAVPTFRWGILVSVFFHRVVQEVGTTVWRHLELHEKVWAGDLAKNSHVLHGLYRGTRTHLGSRYPLSAQEETAGLPDEVLLPFQDLDVQYVPNSRPNRLWRSSALGTSDYQGSETLLDGLDETYASWMRDIRLAKARIVVPREFLGGGGTFDLDHEVYTPVDMEPNSTGTGASQMLAHQFAIRHAEHAATALEFIERIVSNAGYSPASFGLHTEGKLASGTALRVRENKTLLTLKRKGAFWRPAISQVLLHLMLVDKEVFGTDIEPFEPSVEMADSISNDPMELAATVLSLKNAQSASIEIRVGMLHPGWGDDEVQSEVERIKGEETVGGPDPFTIGGGGFSAGPTAANSPTPGDKGLGPDTTPARAGDTGAVAVAGTTNPTDTMQGPGRGTTVDRGPSGTTSVWARE